MFKLTSKQFVLRLLRFLPCQPHNLQPTKYQTIVGLGLLGALAAFADVVEPVGQFAGGLCLPAQLCHQCRGGGFTLVQGADEVVHALPDRQTLVRQRIPGRWQLVDPQQTHLTSPGQGNARLLQAAYGSIFGFAQSFGIAEGTVVETELVEPRHGPAGVSVEVTILLGQDLVERLVDERQRRAHARRIRGFWRSG